MAKGIYIGVTSEVPKYETTTSTSTTNITSDTLSTYFSISGSSGYYPYGSIFELVGYEDETTYCYYVCKKEGSYTFNWTVSSEESYDVFSVTLNNSTIVNQVSGETSGSFTKNLVVGDKLNFLFSKDGSVDEGDDTCTWTISAKITTTTQTQVGTEIKNNIAKKVKKMYIGIGGVAHRIRKAYIGIGNVARPFYTGGELTFFGIESLPSKRWGSGSASIGDYLLFGGGYVSNSKSNNVIGYSSNLSQTSVPSLPKAGIGMKGGTLNNQYAVFAGGYGDRALKAATAYDKNLTQYSTPDLKSYQNFPGVASVANYILFAGGSFLASSGNYYYNDETSIYDDKLTLITSAQDLSGRRDGCAGVSVGNYAVFGGGRYGDDSTDIDKSYDVYDTSLTRSTIANVGPTTYDVASSSNGKYGIFGAGWMLMTNTIVWVIDKSLTSITGVSGFTCGQSGVSYNCLGVNNSDFYLFAGGQYWNSSPPSYYSNIHIYDLDLVHSIKNLTSAREYVMGGSVGKYVLFAGGRTGESSYDGVNTIEIYTT